MIASVRVSKVQAADCPDDGGKWVLVCDHLVDGEWLNGGLIQDTNRRRLATHRASTWADGLTTWCAACQHDHWLAIDNISTAKQATTTEGEQI